MTDVERSTRVEAEARAGRIRKGITVVVKWRNEVIAAHVARDWEALGYKSWRAYIDGEFGEHRIRLHTEDRTLVVTAMSNAGLSMRAIGTAVGIDHSTVIKDLQAGRPLDDVAQNPDPSQDPSGGDFPPPQDQESGTVTGLDGKAYPKKARPRGRTTPEHRPVTADEMRRVAEEEAERAARDRVGGVSVHVDEIILKNPPKPTASRAQIAVQRNLPSLQQFRIEFEQLVQPGFYKGVPTDQLRYWSDQLQKTAKILDGLRECIKRELEKRE